MINFKELVIIAIAIGLITGCSIKGSPGQALVAQSSELKEAVVGEYLLKSVMETGSGLLLSEDGTYKFYLAYGCLDEFDNGKWHIENSSVILKSSTDRIDPQFTFVSSSQEKFDGVRISFEGKDSKLAAYLTHKTLYSNDRKVSVNSNNRTVSDSVIKEGVKGHYVHSQDAVVPIQKISLSFFGVLRVYPEYDYDPIDSNHNNFVFKANKGNYGTVCFDNVKLKIGNGELYLQLPGLQRELKYVRFKDE